MFRNQGNAYFLHDEKKLSCDDPLGKGGEKGWLIFFNPVRSGSKVKAAKSHLGTLRSIPPARSHL